MEEKGLGRLFKLLLPWELEIRLAALDLCGSSGFIWASKAVNFISVISKFSCFILLEVFFLEVIFFERFLSDFLAQEKCFGPQSELSYSVSSNLFRDC